MAKLCPRGKAAAKRKFKVYPSAYANMYASAVCSGKVTPGGKKKRKKAMGGGMMGRRMGYSEGTPKFVKEMQQRQVKLGLGKFDDQGNFQPVRKQKMGSSNKQATKQRRLILERIDRPKLRKNRAGGGMMNRPMYGKGGGVCIRGMNKDAVGKNS